MTTLSNVYIHTDEETFYGSITFDKTIQSISKAQEGGMDGRGMHLIPGFVDQHVHGAMNADTMDATHEALETISVALAQEGVTSFLATTMTESKEKIELALQSIATFKSINGATCVGVHLEGPFLSPQMAGAQDREKLRAPDVDLLESWMKLSGGKIKIVTLAPELPHAKALIQSCMKQGIVPAIGHSDATDEICFDAIQDGVKGFSHAYNAMRPFRHRDAGVVGAMLLSKNTYAELIADGIHVSKSAIRLLLQNKGRDHVILVSDAMRAKSMQDGVYDLGGTSIQVKDGIARTPSGSLAGSTLTMDQACRNLINELQDPWRDLIQMASTNPATNLSLEKTIGSISVGKDADFVLVDKEYRVNTTFIKGRKVFEKNH